MSKLAHSNQETMDEIERRSDKHTDTENIEMKLTDEQIKYMTQRFLGWKLPEHFSPDAGISFTRDYNVNTPYPAKHEPVGTNLFSAEQAEQMIRYLADGMPQ